MFEVTIFIAFFLLLLISTFFNNLPETKTIKHSTTEKPVSENSRTPPTLFTDLTDDDISRATVAGSDIGEKTESEILVALIHASKHLLERVRTLANQVLEDKYFKNCDDETFFDIVEGAVLTENYISETERARAMLLSDPGSMIRNFDSLRVKHHLHLLKTIGFYQEFKTSINDLLLVRDGASDDDIVKYQAGEFLNIIKIYMQTIETAGYSKSDYFNNTLRTLLFDFVVRITCDGATVSPYNTSVINEVFSINWAPDQYLKHYEALRVAESNNASEAPERRLAYFLRELETLNYFALVDFNHVVEFFLFHFASSEPQSDSSDSIIFRFSDLCSQLCQAHRVSA